MANHPSQQNDTFSSMSASLKGSAGRLTRMASQGNKVAIFKLSGMIIGSVMVLWFLWGLFV
jgi:blocked-early-in-transport protein 1